MLYDNCYNMYICKNDSFFSNKSMTLPVESRFDYIAIDISPNGSMLVAINTGKTSFYMHIFVKII